MTCHPPEGHRDDVRERSPATEGSRLSWWRPFAIAQGDMPYTRNRTWQNMEN